ncbi:MAG: hypothetical protein JJE49_05020, partial [Peptostreptococcaceae bacterium]|nr:hypothetical protein [Peptostreptococcaceae bacterium]
IMAKRLSEYIDEKINGIKIQHKECQNTLEEVKAYIDEDFTEVVENLLQMDFSSRSNIKETLKYRLIELINKQSLISTDEDELDLDDLDQVAGGLNTIKDEIKKLEV